MFKSHLTRTQEAPVAKKYKVYTDGSILNNGQPGAISSSVALIENAGREQRFIASYNQTQATSNRAEMIAAIIALQYIKWEAEFTIYSDSEYLVKGFNEKLDVWVKNGWRIKCGSPVSNPDLWKELSEMKKFHKVQMVWVKGHAGNEKNEVVDTLARKILHYPDQYINSSEYLGKKLIIR